MFRKYIELSPDNIVLNYFTKDTLLADGIWNYAQHNAWIILLFSGCIETPEIILYNRYWTKFVFFCDV